MNLLVPETLTTLAERRPVFHSEADFQHALAWELHERLPRAAVRLERPMKVSHSAKPLRVDIWVEQDGKALVLELKYKTRALQTTEYGEPFMLQNHSATDIGRYDFIKDVWRVENIVADSADAVGYAVLLTNEPSYWARSYNDTTIDTAFRLHEGREMHGTVDWGAQAGAGTKRGREEPLRLAGSYHLRWEDYSEASSKNKFSTFRYLLVEAKKPGG